MIPEVEVNDVQRPPVTHPDLSYLNEILPDWHLDAACRDADPMMWFPAVGESTRRAKAICGECPVRAECLDYALGLSGSDDFGIWGGTSERQRRALRKERAA